MKQGYVKAKMGNDWCLIEFKDEGLHGKVFIKLQGEEGAIPWAVGDEMILATKDEILEKMANSYDEGFRACEEKE